MALRKGRYEKLSEQEVIECARSPWDKRLLGCNGGWHFSVYDHAQVHNGVTTQSNRPYKGNTNSVCNTATPRTPGSKTLRRPDPQFHTSTTYYTVQNNNEALIREVLYNQGPLYVTFHVSNEFPALKGGVYTDKNGLCRGKSLNHAVLLIGYGRENGIDFWELKNSWGEILEER